MIDRGRLVRALRLDVEPLEPGRYRVTGGRAAHIVTARGAGRWGCDCTDAAIHHSTVCKHRLGVYFSRQLAPEILVALRAAVAPIREATGRRHQRARA